jgi:formylglycine-generating enzyme required for sulfatase activity
MRVALALAAAALLLAACGDAAVETASCGLAPAAPRPGETADMVAIPAGTTLMGAAALQPGEGPATRVQLAAFRIDRTDVTNAQFAAFVAATGYVTVAERGPEPASLVFAGAQGQIDLNDPSQWWRIVPGADWRHPTGPDSDLDGKANLPVVHVAYEDALAYAHWLGRDLPTEAEWEYAARGGIEGARYAWGDAAPDAGGPRANTWQGMFPLQDNGGDGFKASASPVGCYAPNGYGLYDMAGNVWQWTKDVWRPGLDVRAEAPDTAAFDPRDPNAPQRVIKGGSFLCADNYCLRYRPAARTAAAAGDGASHIGFRTVLRTQTTAQTGEEKQ